MNRAGGLRYGSQITLDGVPIGTVESVDLEIDRERPVLFNCRIDDWVRIPVDHLVKVDAALIGGGTRLAILSLDPSADRATYESGRTPVLTGTFMSLDETLATSLDVRMGPIAESFSDQALGEQLRDLVSTGGPEGVGIGSTIERINATLDQANLAFGAATGWLDDEQLREDARSAIFKANLLIERATTAALAAGRLATTLEAETPTLIASLSSTAAAVDDTLAEIRGLVGRASEGEGTLGRFINDPALYEDLDDAAKRLADTLAAIEALVEAIKAEGIDVDF
jgi:phospholipid/cholesterol/gamma-HCH transport system substrate-binding protein